MKKLFLKLCLCLIPVFLYLGLSYYIDVFNVFHYRNIRITEAAKNDNYIKTRYVIENPTRFNAFILGSSRVGNLPPDGLLQELDDVSLSWYNMTYPMGCPRDNLETVKTFLASGVDVKMVIVGIDEISMYNTYSSNSGEMIEKQYQEYAKNPARFFYDYLLVRPQMSVFKDVLTQDDEDRDNVRLFYEYGVEKRNLSIEEPTEERKMESSLGCGAFNGDEEFEGICALRDLASLCEQNGIELRVFTSPILQTTYTEAVSKGYFDFLRAVSREIEYYNFSGLNKYTTDMKYYFDASHYKPYIGMIIEDSIFSDEKKEYHEFGGYITNENIDSLLMYLEDQMK
ncbi:hypothetical protein [Butyrivibrio sp. MB2005]|uniref:hypothetical protein n=1 Tax=Butyrivibrio sp. MB2005 TaxID=1280678 RepID=UPI0003FB71F6|nr:hypothetical protein [Butyrivibrio sp. MB2005]